MRIFIMAPIDVRFDALLAGIRCIAAFSLSCPRSNVINGMRRIPCTLLVYDHFIVFLSFPRCYTSDASRSTISLLFFMAEYHAFACPLGQVRLRVSLRICFVGIYFLSLFAQSVVLFRRIILYSLTFFRFLQYYLVNCTSLFHVHFVSGYIRYVLPVIFPLLFFISQKLYFLIPLFLVHQG